MGGARCDWPLSTDRIVEGPRPFLATNEDGVETAWPFDARVPPGDDYSEGLSARAPEASLRFVEGSGRAVRLGHPTPFLASQARAKSTRAAA
jgi:hypothetical protein